MAFDTRFGVIPPILELGVTALQELIVPFRRMTMSAMNNKRLFAARLNEALDTSGLEVPPKGKGRQEFVRRMFGVSQKGARKWLEAEGFPTLEKAVEIAKRLSVSIEWLLTGRGDKRIMQHAPNTQAASVLDLWHSMPPHLQEQWVKYGEFLISSGGLPPHAEEKHTKKLQ